MDFLNTLNPEYSQPIMIAAIAIIVIFLVVGFIKKALWMIIFAVVIGAGLFFLQPDKINNAKDTMSEMLDSSMDPLADEDYQDVADELEEME